jgi:hypothetical protein
MCLGRRVYPTDVGRLRPLLSLNNLKLNRVTFLQALITFGRNRAVVHEYIRSVVTADEAVTFCVIEPLHRAFQPFHVRPLSAASLWLRGIPGGRDDPRPAESSNILWPLGVGLSRTCITGEQL